MLEQIHSTPEERRRTETFVHLGVIGFGLFGFAELAARLGPGGVIAGATVGLAGVLYSQWLRGRWTTVRG